MEGVPGREQEFDLVNSSETYWIRKSFRKEQKARPWKGFLLNNVHF